MWAGIAAGGAALGPIASGFLLKHFSWGSVFYVNVPIVIAALIAGRFILPTSRDPEEGKLDPPGALLSIVGLGALVYAIIEAPDHGWASAETLLAFAVAAVVLGALPVVGDAVAPPDAQPGAVPATSRFSVASGGMTLHVLRHVRHLLPAHPVLPARARLRRPEGRHRPAARSPSPS